MRGVWRGCVWHGIHSLLHLAHHQEAQAECAAEAITAVQSAAAALEQEEEEKHGDHEPGSTTDRPAQAAPRGGSGGSAKGGGGGLVEAALRESLRLYPPVLSLPRTVGASGDGRGGGGGGGGGGAAGGGIIVPPQKPQPAAAGGGDGGGSSGTGCPMAAGAAVTGGVRLRYVAHTPPIFLLSFLLVLESIRNPSSIILIVGVVCWAAAGRASGSQSARLRLRAQDGLDRTTGSYPTLYMPIHHIHPSIHPSSHYWKDVEASFSYKKWAGDVPRQAWVGRWKHVRLGIQYPIIMTSIL